jgi:hypothetical protein
MILLSFKEQYSDERENLKRNVAVFQCLPEVGEMELNSTAMK